MARTIYCQYLKKEGEGQDFQLVPGEFGERIFNNICKEAWSLWQKKQTMLINENQLNMMNEKDRNFIQEQMENFLFKGEEVYIPGYKPPEKEK